MDTILNAKTPLTEQQPKRVVLVEIFRAGPQISSTGQKMMFGEDDLDQVVNSYNPTSHEAPLIIGHDQEDGTPALGWVKNVWRKGKELWGKVELTPKAEKLIRDGVFKKVSSSFYLPDADTNPTPGTLALRHLGLVSIPAVKGLTAFSEITGDQTITFTSSEGESSISFKESLEKNSTMARKRTTKGTPVHTVDHADGGGMTVNINIGAGGTKDGTTSPNVYDDGGNKINEVGAPADYDMDYGAGYEDDMMDPSMESYVEGPDGKQMGDEDDGTAPPDPSGDPGADSSSSDPMADSSGAMGGSGGGGAMGGSGGGGAMGGSGVESEDISGDVNGDDQAVNELASKYTEEQLIKALYQQTKSTSMMEGVSYNEFKGAVEEFMEEEVEYGEEEEEDEDEERHYGEYDEEEEDEDGVDHAETVRGGERPKGAFKPSAKNVNGMQPKGEKSCESTEHSESDGEDDGDDFPGRKRAEDENYSETATGTLDHSERTVKSRGRDNLQARVAELEEELARQRKAMREAEITSFCEGVYNTGKLTPKIVPQGDLVRFMETLNAKNTVNFSEAGKTSQYDFFKGVLEALPSMVSFEEVAPQATAIKKPKAPKPPVDGYVYDPATAGLHAKALEYQEQNSGISYETALRAILTD